MHLPLRYVTRIILAYHIPNIHLEEAYADHDSELYEDNDFFGPEEANSDPSYKKEYPEYFIFGCCGDNLEENPDGCKTGWHRDAAPAKKNRYFQ